MQLLSILLVLMFSIVCHEVAHAWVALREGDDTAYKLGRITLNPFAHLGLVGSFLVPVVLYNLTGGAMFGWAKPVPINPNKFHSYRSADIKVSLAGIAANLLLAAAFTVLIVALLNIKGVTGFESFVDLMVGVAWYGVQINLILAFFNLIPIPPLDGSHVIYHFIPAKWQSSYDRLGQYGLILIIACVILVPGLFEFILTPVSKLLEVADSFIRLMS